MACFGKKHSLPKRKILALSKLKVFKDDKLKVDKMVVSVFDREENIVGKGENAGHQNFLLFPTMFPKGFFLRVVNSRDYVVKSSSGQF